MNFTLKCVFLPGEKPKYYWIGIDDYPLPHIRTIEIDRRTFNSEMKIHGKPIKKEACFTEDYAIIFRYHF